VTDALPTLIAGQNSYVSLDDANVIAATRLFASAWTRAEGATRLQALITATSLLDRMGWQGRPIAPTQPLAFPRVATGCPPGYPLSTETPTAIIIATVELAIHLLTTGALSSAPIMQRMLGDSMVLYFPTIADELPKHVRRLIEPHLRSSSANVAEVRF
jgi:uncharacterized protein involved in response to NO